MSKKVDFELISSLALEMSDRIKIIIDFFPKDKEKEFLLKNLAAASIHLALFMKDLVNYLDEKEPKTTAYEKRFLDECGCKEENKNV